MEEYYYFSTIGKWNEKINKDKINDFFNEKEKSKINDPISFCLFNEINKKKILPKKVVLFSTDETENTCNILKEKWFLIRDFEIIKIDQMFDINHIRNLILKKINECGKEKIIFNITGGTKLILISCIMELFNLIILGKNIEIKYVKGKRDIFKGELSNYDDMEIIDINLEELDHMFKNKIIEGKKHLKEGNFSDAYIYFKEGEKLSGEEYLEALFLEKLSLALSFIDSLNYEDSIKLLEDSYEYGKKFRIEKSILDKISEIKNVLKDKENENYKKFIIYNFLNNAERKIYKNPSMSILLIYRSFEILLNFLVKKNISMKESKFSEEINKKYKEIVSYLTNQDSKDLDINKLKNLYLKEFLSILIGSGNKTIEKFYERNKKNIKTLIEYRNKNKYIHWYFDFEIKNKNMIDFIQYFIKEYKILLKEIFFEDNEKFMKIANIDFTI
ncbi:MAG: hypothetical protein KQA41_00055 [Candidatus Aenigmarchaeota archaeon]|nr:hypothetical protein [Candidatus Aenigmarchaeota archaeon]